MAVTINGTNGVVFNDSSTQNTAATGFGFKNRIINGAMMIDQRNAGASTAVSAGNAFFAVDRFTGYFGSSATGCTTQQSSTAPAGFINSLKFAVGTGASSSSTQTAWVGQRVEGLNVADLGWGAAGAASVTLSFWVYSSMTGTFCANIQNSAVDRSYVATYTISSANTWEYKTLTIPGDTSGTWLKTNGENMTIKWDLGSGSNYNTTAGAWQAGNYRNTSAQANLIGTSSATFYITGVQLEKGSTATSFDYRPYGTELALCSRYYQPINSISALASATTAIATNIQFAVPMRATPTISITTTLTIYDGVSNYTQSSANAGSYLGSAYGGLWYSITNFSGLTQYRAYVLNLDTKQDSIRATAEL